MDDAEKGLCPAAPESVARGEADDEAGAAAVERLRQRDRAAVRAGDRADDRKPEPARAAAVAVAAEEALEHLVVQLRRDARAVVLDRQHDLAVAPLHGRLDRGAGIGVAERV